jgi:hypothetical protein
MQALAVCLATCAIWLTFLSSAFASSFGGNSRHDEDHLMAGMKGVTVSERTRTEEGTFSLSGYGAAGFGEATLLHDHLALELEVVMTAPGNERSWAAEPLVLAPLHVSRWFEPFAGLGPMLMTVRDRQGQRFWMGGGEVVVGAYLWLAKNLGVDFDVTLGIAQGPDMSMMEMVFAIGPILRD